MDIERSQSLSRMYRLALYVALAVLVALPVYVLIVEILKGRGIRLGPGLPAATAHALRLGLYGVAVAAVLLLRLLRGMIIRKKPDESPDRLAQKLLQASILTSALSEVPAVLGLVLYLAVGFYRDFYILLIVSLFLMFMFFPRYRDWTSWAGEP